MARKLRKRIAQTIAHALLKRDQLEMQAVDAALSALTPRRRRRRAVTRQPKKARARR